MATQDAARGQLNLKTQEAELTKAHTVYDGSFRVTDVYTAGRNVKNGGPCTRTRYQYSGITNYITGMMEDLDSWDTSWEF